MIIRARSSYYHLGHYAK